MIHQVLLLILATGSFWVLTEGQDSYSQLTELEKKGVDLALQNLYSHPSTQHHFLFFKTLDMVHTEGGFGESFVYHNFFAKATTCAKEIENPDPKKCRFRNDRPLVDCVVCYMGLSDNIARETKPYVSCVRRPALTKEVKTNRQQQCEDDSKQT
ncbi:hypothetical protein GN956_G19206 [Arapaima gigas]